MPTPQTKLILIKSLHTIIWLVLAGGIVYVFISGLLNQITIFTWLAIGATVLETLVLLLFKWSCPLTIVARQYSNSTAPNFDIYLPKWLARHNKSIFTTLFLVGLALVLFRVLLESQ